MLYLVSNALKKRLTQIFQEILSRHPIFEKAKVYTKFPQEERPKTAIIIRAVSGSTQKLGLDNFITTQRGYCTLANLKGVPGNSIEWVKDDQENMDKLSAPGFYIIKITGHSPDSNSFSFTVDPYLICDDEQLDITFIKNKEGAILKNTPINPNSEIIYSQSHQFEFKQNIDYTINYETGEILFASQVKKYLPIIADYQVLSSQTGPFTTEYYYLNNTAIPGVIMAFGDRLKVGDEQVVVVEPSEKTVAKVFGGRWLMDVDVIAIAQDPDQQERLIDYVTTALWADFQDSLANEGIAIRDFSLSGEAEEAESEVGDEYNFSGGIAFSCEVDWEVTVPLISEVRRVNIAYGEEDYKNSLDYLTEEKYELGQYDERMSSSNHQKGLQIVPTLDAYSVCPGPFTPTQRTTRKYPEA